MDERSAGKQAEILATVLEENRRLHEELARLRLQVTPAESPPPRTSCSEDDPQTMGEALRASEARFRRIFDQSPIGAAIVGLDQRFVQVNAAYCRLLGYEEAELVGKTFRDITHPDDLGIGVEQVARLVTGELEVYTANKRYLRKDGRVIWARLSTCMVRDAAGKAICFLPMAEDIDDRRHAELALRDKTEELERYFSVSLDLLCIANLEAVFLRLNPAWTETLGYELSELIGTCFLELVHPDDLDATRAAVAELGRERQVINFVNRYRCRDGSYRWIEWRSTPYGGRLIYAAARDITERIEEERRRAKLEAQLRQSQKLESVGRLAGGIAHDFNNLLTCIIGNLSFLLQKTPTADPTHQPLLEISDAATRAAALTRQLLAFSRQQIIAPVTLDLNALVERLSQMLVRLIGEDIELRTRLQPGRAHVLADPGQLEQVLVNLVVNARDAMPNGGLLLVETQCVTLGEEIRRSRPEVVPGDYVTLAVSDTGIGITESARPYLFDPFYTTKPKEKGTGLGLAMVYGAIKQAGGWVEVTSTAGQGSSFQLFLPRAESEQLSPVAAPESNALPRGTETIVLVEDEAVVRSFAERLLRELGYQVLGFSDPVEALSSLERRRLRVDLLLTDVVMPRLDGQRLAEQLTARRPTLKVLFTSGYPAASWTERGQLDPRIDFLGKPYTAPHLAQRVRRVLDGG